MDGELLPFFFGTLSSTQNIHISAICYSLCTLLFASFKNFMFLLGFKLGIFNLENNQHAMNLTTLPE